MSDISGTDSPHFLSLRNGKQAAVLKKLANILRDADCQWSCETRKQSYNGVCDCLVGDAKELLGIPRE